MIKSNCCNASVIYVSYNPELSKKVDHYMCVKCKKKCEALGFASTIELTSEMEVKEQCTGDEAL